MRFKISCTVCGALAQFMALCPAHTVEIACRDYEGTMMAIDIPDEVSFGQAITEIESKFCEARVSSEYLIDFMVAASSEPAIREKGALRNYKDTLTDNDKRQIDYIISTLGHASLLSIAKSKSDLKRAGTQIERVHPFRFLSYVFANEKLRAALQNMTTRSWIWKEYFDGIKRSFEEESARGNMLGHIHSFASSLSVDEDTLYKLVKEKKWKEFMQFLLQQRPRTGNFERYDM